MTDFVDLLCLIWTVHKIRDYKGYINSTTEILPNATVQKYCRTVSALHMARTCVFLCFTVKWYKYKNHNLRVKNK